MINSIISYSLLSSETFGGEIILIFLIVLLLFGAKKVPELFRSLGKGVNEFRKAKNEWEQDINDVMNQEPLEDHDFKQDEKNSEDPEKPEPESAPAGKANHLILLFKSSHYGIFLTTSKNGLVTNHMQPLINLIATITLKFHYPFIPTPPQYQSTS